MNTFKRSLPVTLTSFINKSGTIGLSIIPILLVEKHVATELSASIMGAIRAAGLAGILLGGWSCDRFGLRRTLLASFVISGIGLAPLPFFGSAALIAALACLAQLGTSLYYASARLLLTQIVPVEERREAIAWQRTANNLAQVISYSLGAALSRFGTTILILFDALTSFIATGVGARILPDAALKTFASPVPDEKTDPSLDLRARRRAKRDFYQCALIIASFSFLYDMYEVGAAARCKIMFGADGLAVYSETMVINTVLCALLSVAASKRLTDASFALPAGVALQMLGLVLTFGGDQSRWHFFVGIFVMTLGEIVFNSLAAIVLIHFTPPGRRQATTYSTGVLVQFIGRIAGSTLAFPLLIAGAHPLRFVLVAAAGSLAICVASRPLLARTET